jgi:GntR family transcriptional repressor for pyruvate dehydrogenase complex
VARSLTEQAIDRIREFVRSGRFPAGAKLPPENELASELGISRSPTREAVKALSLARVLEIRGVADEREHDRRADRGTPAA